MLNVILYFSLIFCSTLSLEAASQPANYLDACTKDRLQGVLNFVGSLTVVNQWMGDLHNLEVCYQGKQDEELKEAKRNLYAMRVEKSSLRIRFDLVNVDSIHGVSVLDTAMRFVKSSLDEACLRGFQVVNSTSCEFEGVRGACDGLIASLAKHNKDRRVRFIDKSCLAKELQEAYGHLVERLNHMLLGHDLCNLDQIKVFYDFQPYQMVLKAQNLLSQEGVTALQISDFSEDVDAFATKLHAALASQERGGAYHVSSLRQNMGVFATKLHTAVGGSKTVF